MRNLLNEMNSRKTSKNITNITKFHETLKLAEIQGESLTRSGYKNTQCLLIILIQIIVILRVI